MWNRRCSGESRPITTGVRHMPGHMTEHITDTHVGGTCLYTFGVYSSPKRAEVPLSDLISKMSGSGNGLGKEEDGGGRGLGIVYHVRSVARSLQHLVGNFCDNETKSAKHAAGNSVSIHVSYAHTYAHAYTEV